MKKRNKILICLGFMAMGLIMIFSFPLYINAWQYNLGNEPSFFITMWDVMRLPFIELTNQTWLLLFVWLGIAVFITSLVALIRVLFAKPKPNSLVTS